MGSRLPREDKSAILVAYIRFVSGLNRIIGEIVSWLALAMVLVCFTVVVQRYVFHTSFLPLQDLYVWMNGAMFTGVAGFALLRDDHVRVDIFYRPWSIRRKAIADLIGVVVFLIPFMIVVLAYGAPYVQRSWRIWEGSANIGGMPGLFVLKTLIPAFALLVLLQGMAWAFRSILVLANREGDLPEHLRYKRHAPDPSEAVL